MRENASTIILDTQHGANDLTRVDVANMNREYQYCFNSWQKTHTVLKRLNSLGVNANQG